MPLRLCTVLAQSACTFKGDMQVGTFKTRRLLLQLFPIVIVTVYSQSLHEELIDELHKHLYVRATAKKPNPLGTLHIVHAEVANIVQVGDSNFIYPSLPAIDSQISSPIQGRKTGTRTFITVPSNNIVMCLFRIAVTRIGKASSELAIKTFFHNSVPKDSTHSRND